MVWLLHSALPNIKSFSCYQGRTGHPFFVSFLYVFVMEEIRYRGRGSKRLRGLSFSLSLSFPYDQWSIEEY